MAVPSRNGPCWLNSVSTATGVNKEVKKYIFKKPCDVAVGCEVMPEPSGQSQRGVLVSLRSPSQIQVYVFPIFNPWV